MWQPAHLHAKETVNDKTNSTIHTAVSRERRHVGHKELVANASDQTLRNRWNGRKCVLDDINNESFLLFASAGAVAIMIKQRYFKTDLNFTASSRSNVKSTAIGHRMR